MDDLFDAGDFLDSGDFSDDDILFPHVRRRRRLCSDESSLSLRHDRLFFVPYRWWKDAKDNCIAGEARNGVLYTASSGGEDCDLEWEIVLSLERETHDDDDEEEEANEEEERENASVDGLSAPEYALISESMWFKALKWHSDYCSTIKDIGCSLAAEDNKQEVFPIKIRLSMMHLSNLLVVKILQMDNPVLLYGRACRIFGLQSNLLRIWDFSGWLTQFVEGNAAVIPNGCVGQVDKEVHLELQVHGLPIMGNDMDVRKCGTALRGSNTKGSLGSSSIETDGSVESDSPASSSVSLRSFTSRKGEAGTLGLTGLLNLGNTCFMNSAIQCLAHTPKLVDYFLGDYKKEINYENPLGMNGELALAFGDLIRKLWMPGGTPVAPKLFKSTLDRFAPQFSGYNQHDSQEFLAFLLDGLHEDLNRVKHKPYTEIRDAEGCPDDQVADEYWQNHLARNDSIIVDLCHGQYRSTLVCPVCRKMSVMFDPFMYLSLPLPSTTVRSMTVTVLSTDGGTLPSTLTVTVPKCGRFKDLIHALSVACSLSDDETLLVAEVFNHCILRFLEDPYDLLALVRDDDCLVAYRLPKKTEGYQLVVFTHQRTERRFGYMERSWTSFGIPLVAKIYDLSNGTQIQNEYMKLIYPFLKIDDDDDDDGNAEISSRGVAGMVEESTSNSDDSLSSNDDTGAYSHDFQFHFAKEHGISGGCEITSGEVFNVVDETGPLNVRVSWSERMLRRYDIELLSLLPEIFKPGVPAVRPPVSVSLYKCLEGFLKEEPLGLEDMWYCPNCKKHQQASKKLDLWRLPEILVVHLKRFSYSRFLKNKLGTFVDFPIEELDLSGFLAHKNITSSNHYRLYAVSNHYGSMAGGHYTAVVNHGSRWYEFNDSIVEPIGVDDVKTSAAYVLFYRRITST